MHPFRHVQSVRVREHGRAGAILLLASLLVAAAWLVPALGATPDEEAWQFAAGRLRFGILAGGGASTAHKIRDANLLTVFPRIGYVLAEQRAFLPGSLEVVGELSYLPVYQYRDSDLFGLAALFKYNFRTGNRLTPFIEAGGGGTYATVAVPETGTNFNFLAQGGAGFHFALTDRFTFDFRAIYHHLSNANLSDQNPSLNSVLFTIGISYTQ